MSHENVFVYTVCLPNQVISLCWICVRFLSLANARTNNIFHIQDLNQEISVNGYENLPLCNVERILRCKVEEYRKIKQSRLHRLAELKRKVSMYTEWETATFNAISSQLLAKRTIWTRLKICKLQGIERRQLSISSRDCLLWNMKVQYYHHRILLEDPTWMISIHFISSKSVFLWSVLIILWACSSVVCWDTRYTLEGREFEYHHTYAQVSQFLPPTLHHFYFHVCN